MAELDFIHRTVVSELWRPDGMAETLYGRAFWAVAHRGFSGGGRLDLWAHRDEMTAMRAAAELAIECLDDEPIAANHFKNGDYRAVMDRYAERTPESNTYWRLWRCRPWMTPDNFFETSADVRPR